MNNDLLSQINKIVESKGFNLYDIEILKENGANIFRVSISSSNGINHDDCQVISDIISPLLDIYNIVDDGYFLEVSSPGLERILKKPNHFKLSINQKIKITLNDKTKLIGILKSADENGFYLDSKYYKYSDIKKAKSILEW